MYCINTMLGTLHISETLVAAPLNTYIMTACFFIPSIIPSI
jgi:hypothetical protein